MKERPIIFNADMVRAILDGRKTQTRRPLKVQPPSSDFVLSRIVDSTDKKHCGRLHWVKTNKDQTRIIEHGKHYFSCPFGQPGDRLWVRETFAEAHYWTQDIDTETPLYKVADEKPAIKPVKWKPSIHMPRWASRILLEITDVRVERVQDISEDDSIAEGVQPNCCLQDHTDCDHGGEWFLYTDDDLAPDVPAFSAKESFASLWNYINGTKAWGRNDWVWVIEFKRIEPA